MISSVTTLSPSLPETPDGNYGPVLPFVPDPQREVFGLHTSRLPISHTKCKWPSFIKMEVKECTILNVSTVPLQHTECTLELLLLKFQENVFNAT